MIKVNKTLLLILHVFLILGEPTSAQQFITENRFEVIFDEAYTQNPTIPRGILEAVAFSNTGISEIEHNEKNNENCMGMPRPYGVMGLFEDGKHVFRDNLLIISELSGYSAIEIESNTRINILAYAKAYAKIQQRVFSKKNIDKISLAKAQSPVLIQLSELPLEKKDNYALDYYLYSVFKFINDPYYQSLFKFNPYRIELKDIFGEKKLQILKSTGLIVGRKNGTVATGDYPAAVWITAPQCNYSSGRNKIISAIVIHDIEGSYQSAIAWFSSCPCSESQCSSCPQNTRGCNNGKPIGPTSAHYIVSKFGQIAQMVREADKAYHVGTENAYTVGIEHDGFCGNSYPVSLYKASSLLVKDICSRYHIDRKTSFQGTGCSCDGSNSCVKDPGFRIRGHQMFPNQTHTDPGPGWDWAAYYQLIIN